MQIFARGKGVRDYIHEKTEQFKGHKSCQSLITRHSARFVADLIWLRRSPVV